MNPKKEEFHEDKKSDYKYYGNPSNSYEKSKYNKHPALKNKKR